jgi:hypothetical protein
VGANWRLREPNALDFRDSFQQLVANSGISRRQLDSPSWMKFEVAVACWTGQLAGDIGEQESMVPELLGSRGKPSSNGVVGSVADIYAQAPHLP